MAKCDLTLHLDDEKETFLPGQIVRGTLEVRVDEAVKCKALEVGLRWRTHGKGNSTSETVSSMILYEGEWESGALFRGPFEFELPAGPYTYHGHYLNVVWEVFASVDIPWAIDPRVEREVALRADPEAEPDWLTAAGSRQHIPSDLSEKAPGGAVTETAAKAGGCGGNAGNILGVGCLLMFLVPMVTFFAFAVRQGMAFARGELPLLQAVPWLLLGVVLLGLFIAGAVKVGRNIIARKKLGQVTLGLEPDLVRAGEELRVSIGCTPQKGTDLVAASARIVATEVVVRGSGTSRKTFRQVVYDQEVEIAGGRPLPPNLPFHAGSTIPIPADAPPSFFASDNRLIWSVTARLDIARWPDWVEEREFLVHP